MDYRSPLESIFGVINGLPQGHDKPVKHAVYNAVAMFLLFLCCTAGWALYMILEPFFKPLIWALLVGSALHPLKRSLRYRFQSWFDYLEETHTPVILGVVLLPINIINDLSNFIGDNLWKRLKLIIGVCVAIPAAHLIYCYTPRLVSSIVWLSMVYVYQIFNFCLSVTTLPLVLLVLFLYLSAVVVLWKPENNTRFHFASIVVWILCSACLSKQFGGSFQMPVFIALQLTFFGGFIWEVIELYKGLKTAGHPVTVSETILLAFDDSKSDLEVSGDDLNSEEDKLEESSPLIEEIEEPTSPVTKTVKFQDSKPESPQDNKDPWSLDLFQEKTPNIKRTDSDLSNTSVLITNQGIHVIQKQPSEKKRHLQRSMSQPQFFPNARNRPRSRAGILSLTRKLSFRSLNESLEESEKYESTFYLYSIVWACIVMLFWKNVMLLPLLPIPILLYVIKHVGYYLGIWNYLHKQGTSLYIVLSEWCYVRYDALVPVPIRGLLRFIHTVNNGIKSRIRESIDTVSSCVVIIGLIVFVSCASLFFVLQIYAEAIMMAQMMSNVIDQTVVHNPELRQLLPPDWDDTVDSILDNAYQYGREGISKGIKSMMTDADSAKSEKLEHQVLELWDRLYQTWMSSNDSNGPKVTDEAIRTSWDSFISDIKKSPEIFNVNGLVDFAQQNLGTLISLLESVWGLVKGNIGLLLGSFSAFLSIILGGGTAVLNFILNMVVFFTTLFYLLNSSGDLYKPVELLTNFSPSGRRFGHALEGAINGVFSASFKMAAFYGLWTWFIHNLFGVKIVYLPSVCAMVLGAVPFLGTYWACIPAVLDLWLAQDRGVAAILFAGFQVLPVSIVDTIIYKEIKGGGHPYLTGLAIAGGIFCLGFEGAIMGPMLLCGLYVAIDLSSSLFRESPSEENLNLRFRN